MIGFQIQMKTNILNADIQRGRVDPCHLEDW